MDEIVERPQRVEHRRSIGARTRLVLGTVETGKAIRIELNGQAEQSIRNTLSNAAKRAGLKAHVVKDGPEHVIAWCARND